ILALRRLDAGAERDEAERALDLGRYRPGAVALAERDLVEGGATKPAPRREERDRLEQIGLAGAVRADQDDGTVVDRARRGVIAAEVRQRQAADAGGGHRALFRAYSVPTESEYALKFLCLAHIPDRRTGGHFAGICAAHDPEKWTPVFGQDHAPKKPRAAASDSHTRIGISTYSAPFESLSWTSVGEPGSASPSTAVPPSICAAMSSR